MASTRALLLVALAAAAALANVFVLDDNNFDQVLAEHNPMLVEFYAPWCGHCKALEPEYEEAGKILTNKKAKAYLGKVDATSEAAAELAKRFEVQGFPTLKYFPSGEANSEVIDYDGERKATNIVNWLEKKIGPAFVTLATEADLNKAKATVTADNEKIIVFGVFASKEQASAFEKVAKKDFSRDYYAVVGNVDVGAKLNSAAVPFLAVHRSFNVSNLAVVSGPETLSDAGKIEKFIAASSEPTSFVVTFSDDDLRETVKKGFHAVEFYAPWCGYCKQFAPEYEKVAAHYLEGKSKTKVTIAKYDGTTNDEMTESEKIESFPTIKLYRDGVSAVYKGELDAKRVLDFIEEKASATASTVGSQADIGNFVSDAVSALVACVTAAHDSTIDTLAFQSASSSLKVGKLRCAEGKESIDFYKNGYKVATFPEGQLIGDIHVLNKWFKRAAVSRVFKFDDEAFDDVMDAEYKYVVFFFSNQINGNEPEIKFFEELASSNTFEDTAYSYSSASEEYLLQYFQLKADQLPAVRLLEIQGSMTSYIGPDKLTVDSLEDMFAQLKLGTLEKVSAPVNDDNEGDDHDDHDHGEHEEADDDEDDEEEDDDGDADDEDGEEDDEGEDEL